MMRLAITLANVYIIVYKPRYVESDRPLARVCGWGRDKGHPL